ncbi:MAG: chorismate mutase [Anaeroplasmataceae bacterium]|nr:chorismate mutase [Anaeroplasmataceae bacterium]
MTKLEEAREIIQSVDLEMIELFKKRMVASKLVAEYKKENQLPILDEAREKFLIEKNLKSLNDETLESYYMTFFKGVLDSSKDYQKDLNR